MNTQTATATTTTTATTVTLAKVPADHKLVGTQVFLVQGRSNKATPLKPYYHITQAGLLPPLPQLAELPATAQPALALLFKAAGESLLKEKAEALTPGASISITTSVDSILAHILDTSTRERSMLSGSQIEYGYCGSDAFAALATSYGWTAAQLAVVTAALKQLAAPGYRKPAAEAKLLLDRLAPFLSFLPADDLATLELNEELRNTHAAIINKLTKDAASTSSNLLEAI